MKNTNKGFTLVELIVVIAIVGVIAGVVGLSSSFAAASNAKQAASDVSTMISKCRTGALSRTGDVYLTIEKNGNETVCVYYEDGTKAATKTLPSRVSVTYKTDNGVGSSQLPMKLAFDRSTGAQKAIDGRYITEIVLTGGGRSYTITLVPSTGSHRWS